MPFCANQSGQTASPCTQCPGRPPPKPPVACFQAASILTDCSDCFEHYGTCWKLRHLAKNLVKNIEFFAQMRCRVLPNFMRMSDGW
ncbi:MAG: hypothetical protein ACRC10_09080 [Thermoguttaceae bacterium]